MRTFSWWLGTLLFQINSLILSIPVSARMWLDGIRNFTAKRRQEVKLDEQSVDWKIIIVTGSNSGIGKQTAKELAARGATVIMACRDPKRAKSARKDIIRQVPDAKLVFMQLDMSDLNSIQKFVQEFKERYDHLDVLVNNAGIFTPIQTFNKHGFENHMGTNYLGPFLLTLLLLEPLMKSEHARIVFVSSTSTLLSDLHIENLMARHQPLSPLTLYGNSKLALAIFSKELSKLLAGTNVRTYALCTGMVRTNIMDKSPAFIQRIVNWVIMPLAAYPVEDGAENVLYCILSKALKEESGRFYRYLDAWDEPEKVICRYSGPKLWEISEELVGLKGFRAKLKTLQRD